MPVVKPKSSSSLELMKSEGNDSSDTIIRQAIKEPLLSFSRPGDSPVQLIQLLHALDQQELPGWPLLTPLKDSTKNRDLLGAFWDKLSLEEAKEMVSLKNVTLDGVPGSSIVKSLTALTTKPGFSTSPQVYLRAGSALLDIIRSSRFPISAQELFGILDVAVGLETKNLVACTSFLVEQKLVKAWLADQDAEAAHIYITLNAIAYLKKVQKRPSKYVKKSCEDSHTMSHLFVSAYQENTELESFICN
ncbi:hypothetical protein CMV_010582 [Castanea mollissima]|uniref:Uncharacterized protein n=1 Tax=Castanea mollissima TaxID=60419 RepID=A0A8J4RF13_9ROSI|nr:hypothetical protein CMV_010582 [Castanea mollissima]